MLPSSWLLRRHERVEAPWVAWRDGDATAESWERAREFAASYIDFRVGRVIWSEMKNTYPTEFAAEIDRELALSEPGTNDRVVLRMLDAVAKLSALEGNASASAASAESSQ